MTDLCKFYANPIAVNCSLVDIGKKTQGLTTPATLQNQDPPKRKTRRVTKKKADKTEDAEDSTTEEELELVQTQQTPAKTRANRTAVAMYSPTVFFGSYPISVFSELGWMCYFRNRQESGRAGRTVGSNLFECVFESNKNFMYFQTASRVIGYCLTMAWSFTDMAMDEYLTQVENMEGYCTDPEHIQTHCLAPSNCPS
ncbi:hypothetical protein GHT06_003760 [Daphnia sinensis]|uniref:Uncharacterized protein n=1 Tax=Daphnia sinensis TaxID=1820382 RepID=A0AAD5KDU8_9CRUS|nr:hypothetical protein GHT06_003760 [Daphnia sinensis]